MSVKDFNPAVTEWFSAVFAEPTAPQKRGWPPIARGESTLILAPTGSGKTLTAFLWSLNRLMFEPPPDTPNRCRVLYISPLKALAVDVERNLRAPLVGISQAALALGVPAHSPVIGLRRADRGAVVRLARDFRWRVHVDPGADRFGKNTRSVSLVLEPFDVQQGARGAAALSGSVCLAAQGAGG